MSPTLDAKILENCSLRREESGAIRVGKTRITLDLIVDEYHAGKTPEEIVYAYDVLALADVYAAIAFSLKYPAEVSAYLSARRMEGDAFKATMESRQPRLSKHELLARRAALEQDRAPAR